MSRFVSSRPGKTPPSTFSSSASKRRFQEVESDSENQPSEEDNNDSESDWSEENDEAINRNDREENEEDRDDEEEIDPNIPLYQLLQSKAESLQSTSVSTKGRGLTKKIQRNIKNTEDSGNDSDSTTERKRNKNAPAEMRSDRPVKR